MRVVFKTWTFQGGELWKDIPGKNDKYEKRHRSMKDCSLVKKEVFTDLTSMKRTRGFKRR